MKDVRVDRELLDDVTQEQQDKIDEFERELWRQIDMKVSAQESWFHRFCLELMGEYK